MRKNETKKLFEIVFVVISIRRLKEALMFIERYSLVNKTAKKLLFRLTIIRKKYLCFQKNKVLQSFKGYFRPLKEQGQAEKIIS